MILNCFVDLCLVPFFLASKCAAFILWEPRLHLWVSSGRMTKCMTSASWVEYLPYVVKIVQTFQKVDDRPMARELLRNGNVIGLGVAMCPDSTKYILQPPLEGVATKSASLQLIASSLTPGRLHKTIS